MRSLVTGVGLVVGLVFWSIPVWSIQAWTSLDPSQEHWRWTMALSDSAYGVLIYTFLQKYLPVLALMCLQLVLPLAFALLSMGYEGCKTKSQITRSVLRRNFRYQLCTLYVSVFCGSIAAHEQLRKIAMQPEELFVVLSEEVPQVATYFIMYVMARAGIGLPLLLLYPAVHLRNFRQATQQGPPPMPCYFEAEAAHLGLVLVLGLTYSVIAPALMPVCAVFFALAALVYNWLFLYVYTPEFDCTGKCWYELCNGAMLGLVLGTLSLAALASAFVGFGSGEFNALLALALLVLLVYSRLHYQYAVPSKFMSFADACKLDRMCEKDPRIASMLEEDYYVDPILKKSEVGSGDGTASSPALAWRGRWWCCQGRPGFIRSGRRFCMPASNASSGVTAAGKAHPASCEDASSSGADGGGGFAQGSLQHDSIVISPSEGEDRPGHTLADYHVQQKSGSKSWGGRCTYSGPVAWLCPWLLVGTSRVPAQCSGEGS
mmetsp:Transcript_94675/g.287636  ORF Transcript_94675/g.287636 Transcript_94675/m.287636 type:complete len:488 (-) Transcript_94675:339-1802(-)